MRDLNSFIWPENVKGRLFKISKIHSIESGGPFGDIKNFKKSQCRNKIERGILSRSALYVTLKNERGDILH